MDLETLWLKWQDAIRTLYPGVILRLATNPDGDTDALPWFMVFMIPDGKTVEFIEDFFMDKRHAMMEKYNLPDADFSPVSVTNTRTYHPDIYREARSEFAGKSIAKTPRKSRARTSRTPRSTPVVSKGASGSPARKSAQ